MDADEIKRLVRQTMDEEFGHGPKAGLQFVGGCSKKMIGDAVAQALLHSQIVVIDGSKLRSVGGRKVHWK